MIILLSPAKIQNFAPHSILTEYTECDFLKEAQELVEVMRQYNAVELAKLLKINFELAELNIDRLYNWHRPFTVENAKQAILVFHGEVFLGLNAETFSADDFQYAQQHLRIFSGLYGLLKPFDLIQAYRLDVADKIQLPSAKNLYTFWQDKITHKIKEELVANNNIILNLASNEYFKILNLKYLNANIINVDFLEQKYDGYKSVTIYTKKARGLMARYVIQHQITDPTDLQGFMQEGYGYNAELSSERKMVFCR